MAAGTNSTGWGPTPDSKSYDRSGTKGTGNEPLRQTGNQLTTNYPVSTDAKTFEKGSEADNPRSQELRGWVSNSFTPTVEDGMVADDGHRRLRTISGPGGPPPMGSAPTLPNRSGGSGD